MKNSFLDFDSRERRADYADRQLESLGVHLCRRALVYFFIVHKSVDHPRDSAGGVIDRTTWETGEAWPTIGRWIASNFAGWQGNSPADGTLSRALKWWKERRVMLAIPAGRVIKKRFFAAELCDWVVQESDRIEMISAARLGESSENSDPCAALRGVARPCASLERERDSMDFSEEENKTKSLSLSLSSLELLRLDGAFDREITDRAAYDKTGEWFQAHDFPTEWAIPVLGAVLAARHRMEPPDQPGSYVASVLKNGVSEKWINSAKKLHQSIANPAAYSGR